MKKIMHTILPRVAALLLVMPFFVSCEKGSDALSAIIRLYPHRIDLNAESVKDTTVAEGAILHIFYADSTDWGIFSYEDAEEGILYSRVYEEETDENGQSIITAIKKGDQTLLPQFTDRVVQYDADGNPANGAPTANDEYRYIKSGPVTQQIVFAVVCDPDTGIYGWREIEIAGGLAELRLTGYFDKTRTADYLHYKWNMHIQPANPAEPEGPEDPVDPEE